MSAPRAAARAIDALRRGWPIAIRGESGTLSLMAIETGDAARLAEFDPESSAPVLISAGRAATLKLANQRDAAVPDAPVLVQRALWLDFDGAVALADPQLDLATPLKGPFCAIPVPVPDAAAAALRLARVAGLLPAFFIREGEAEGAITSADIDAHEDPARLRIVTRARLPVAGAENAEIVAFRTPESPDEHVALLIGQPNGTAPLVRLHSECLTGDVLGSLKCDCGPQLHAAIHAIAENGWGVLLYLRQEGRGIGLINKLRAYALQDQGFDTVDANTRLGFAVDARDFGVAGRMLRLLGQDRVRLLTNNPEKVAGLEATGIAVAERVPHSLPPNPHNERYLATKRDRTGHQL
ncbi:GTP cyclohydrolase II [Sphingomonas koreensis]|uniref:GTP cyclohydrolase-2 n=1 Tax=Sphingomonas koreensis TaxID=93064 RepID=A0A1L6J7Z5_9SPHN|nr:GTP cyclohydrolase II [Sphingomonas koreensis]APR51670.1 GTP cyclohydrolase II [Sphingomonas koreensis]MDC7811835.1 GTP cyclohydrolase II [Sphingomonas koreensis]RSU21285.1 GTP cyclohydrolase II [Sphingomonas koreensis]RSU23723.1 GTP cyclohydrolase II [Sphingomonas koreensis]RSU32150.1 GTP cyclohydrolase II [Sphingomonas koreensis]